VRHEGTAQGRLREDAPSAAAARKARFIASQIQHRPRITRMNHGWLMKTKRGRAAVLRRPNWGKAAALPHQRKGLWGQERNLGLHEPAARMNADEEFLLSVSALIWVHPRANGFSLIRVQPQPRRWRTQNAIPTNSTYFHLFPLNST
jgi:hypothetical protein